MDAQKLRAILAHEIGHLRSKDCVDGCAFMIAITIPALMGKLVYYSSIKFSKKTRLFLSGIVLITLLLSLFISSKILIAFVTIKILPVIFNFLRKAFMIPWLTLGRVAEYRQDAFSASLGYALDLKSALLKLTAEGGAGPSVWSIIFTGSHPDLHNRIRRLEAYGGQRNEEGVVESVS
ncbi:MAG: M48 family metalloprotease, partial [Puia sp.]